MNLRLGIYEIFSRIIPGGLYIVVLVQLLSTLGIVKFSLLQVVNDLSLAMSIGLVVVAYILGGAFDNLSLALFQIFKRKDLSAQRLEYFKKSYQDHWQIDFHDYDWHVLLALIRTKNLELASELDRHNALSIMLRNVSLGLLFMVGNSVIRFIVSRETSNIFIALAMLVISMLVLRESVKFRGWFYDSIYQTVLAYRINLETVITPVPPGDHRRKAEKKSHLFRKTTIPKEEQ